MVAQSVPPAWDDMASMEPGFADVTLGAPQDAGDFPLFMQNTALSFSEGSPGDVFIPDFLRYMPPQETSLSGYATPRGVTEPTFNWDLDLSGIDIAHFDQSFLYDNSQHDTLQHNDQPIDQHTQPRPQDPAAVDRARAFDRSVWRYTPRDKTNPVTAGEGNLAFPDGQSEGQSPAHIPPRNITNERLSYPTRDQLLALVLDSSSRENTKKIAAGFPSLDLLDGMIQIFFSSPSIDAGSYFHIPTFSPNQIHPVLLACIIAAGACSTPDDLLQKLGLALYEVGRVSVAKSIDEDNSNIRNIQYLQVGLGIIYVVFGDITDLYS